MVQITNSKQ